MGCLSFLIGVSFLFTAVGNLIGGDYYSGFVFLFLGYLLIKLGTRSNFIVIKNNNINRNSNINKKNSYNSDVIDVEATSTYEKNETDSEDKNLLE